MLVWAAIEKLPALRVEVSVFFLQLETLVRSSRRMRSSSDFRATPGRSG
jgi:hypothetical protein